MSNTNEYFMPSALATEVKMSDDGELEITQYGPTDVVAGLVRLSDDQAKTLYEILEDHYGGPVYGGPVRKGAR